MTTLICLQQGVSHSFPYTGYAWKDFLRIFGLRFSRSRIICPNKPLAHENLEVKLVGYDVDVASIAEMRLTIRASIRSPSGY